MAHEALKFNVVTENNENWQPIVGCQDYGTFYMIYIRFTKLVEKDGKFHYYAEFRLQNYYGQITMGFEGKPQLMELDDDQKEIRNKRLIKLMINEGIVDPAKQKELLEMHKVDYVLEINTKPFHTNFHLPPKKLKSTKKRLNKSILETDCSSVAPGIELYNPDNPQNSKFINPYHYQRAGDETLEVGLRNENSVDEFNYYGNAGTWLSKCNPNRSFLL